MGRIAKRFDELSVAGRKGLIPFITAGDPDMGITYELLLQFGECGAAVIELGVPFTDPMADGPVIQRSSQRALERGGCGVAEILELVDSARKLVSVPIVLFGYLNPFFAYGFRDLSRDASSAGVDGLLITDIVDQEFNEAAAEMKENDLDLISLVAPTTSDTRMQVIVEQAGGFIYAVSRTGVTGEGADSSMTARNLVKRVREVSDLPVAVGFGISDKAGVSEVLSYADAAVVGSAIVSIIEQTREKERVPEAVRSFTEELISG